MKVRYLGPESRVQIALALEPHEDRLDELPAADVIISYRYRHIIPWRLLKAYRGRIINIHTSLLPWQRGAHPVFWAFMEGTSHGVTIHEIDRGIDTGPIIVQVPVTLDIERFTFRSAWEYMNKIAEDTFLALWPGLLQLEAQPQGHGGSEHKAKDKDIFHPVSWDEPVSIYLEAIAEEELSIDCADLERKEIAQMKAAGTI